jgi:hypothetical protein
MSKKVLLGLVGLPRTFKKTSKYLFDNLINNNSDYEFEIIINTDSKFINTGKYDSKKSKYSYDTIEELEINFNITYGNIIKKITYLDYDPFCNSYPWLVRISHIINNQQIDNYDFFIFLRMDVIIVNPINLNNITDTLYIGTHPYQRSGIFLNKDWDFLWIADKNSFYLFFSNFVEYFKKTSNDNRLQINNNINFDICNDYELNNNDINIVTQFGSLTGSYIPEIWKSIYLLMINNKKIIFEDNVQHITGEEKYNNEYLFEQPELLMKV